MGVGGEPNYSSCHQDPFRTGQILKVDTLGCQGALSTFCGQVRLGNRAEHR